MGKKCFHWFVCSLGDGVTFPERPRREDTEGLLGNGQRWPESGEGDSCSEQENLQSEFQMSKIQQPRYEDIV